MNMHMYTHVRVDARTRTCLYTCTRTRTRTYTCALLRSVWFLTCVCACPAEPLNIFQDQYKTENFPVRLSYHNGNHYNSVLDPLNPSVGVGLGMPNLQPGVCVALLVVLFCFSSDIYDVFVCTAGG